MTEMTVRGKFMWHTLLTADAKAAAEFYGKVIGWKSQNAPDDPEYLLLIQASGMLGGVREFPEEQPANDGSHWLPYVGTPDIRATVEQCRSLGGTVRKDVTAIPNTGEFAVLADPQGAEFAVYTPSGAADGKETAAKVAEFSWHELATTDLTAAIDFYGQLFGWEEIAAHDMGPMGTYFIFGRNGKQLGGMFNVMGEDPAAPNWLSYVRVADVDKAVGKVKAAGGRVTNGPMEVPGGDWIAQCIDPQGAAFALHALQNVAKAKPATPTATPETAAAESEDFAATLVMDRDAFLAPPAKKKAKRKGKPAAARTPAKSAKTGKTAAKKAKKPAAKTMAAVAKKSKKTPKKAGKKVVKVGKKLAKQTSKPVKAVARKKVARAPAKPKKKARAKK